MTTPAPRERATHTPGPEFDPNCAVAELANIAVGSYLGKIWPRDRDKMMADILDRLQTDAYAEGRSDARQEPLPAKVVLRIKKECDALGLDIVAFAWRIQKEASA